MELPGSPPGRPVYHYGSGSGKASFGVLQLWFRKLRCKQFFRHCLGWEHIGSWQGRCTQAKPCDIKRKADLQRGKKGKNAKKRGMSGRPRTDIPRFCPQCQAHRTFDHIGAKQWRRGKESVRHRRVCAPARYQQGMGCGVVFARKRKKGQDALQEYHAEKGRVVEARFEAAEQWFEESKRRRLQTH